VKEKILISRCLLGGNCKYNGGNNYTPEVESLKERYELVPVCPEVLGGLPTPREPAERQGDRVVTRGGADVTAEYRLGAERTLAIAEGNGVTRAVLMERSPSCGCGSVYDGTFTGTLVPGSGVTAELLAAHGIEVMSPRGGACAPPAP